MSSLRQHFQNLKATVDWCWTLAILCMIGYFTLGQLVQIYWAMVIFGSIAGSFGLFYEFSCQKLAELDDIEDIYKLQKLLATAAAQKLIGDFSTRNSEIVLQLPDFTQATQPVSNSRTKAAQKLQKQVNFQKQAERQQSSRSSSQQSSPPSPQQSSPPSPQQSSPPSPQQSSPSSSQQPSSSESLSKLSPRQSPQPRATNRAQSSAIPRNKKGVSRVPLQNFSKSRLTDEEYKLTLNKADYEWVKSHSRRNGTPVKGYWRRKRNRK